MLPHTQNISWQPRSKSEEFPAVSAVSEHIGECALIAQYRPEVERMPLGNDAQVRLHRDSTYRKHRQQGRQHTARRSGQKGSLPPVVLRQPSAEQERDTCSDRVRRSEVRNGTDSSRPAQTRRKQSQPWHVGSAGSKTSECLKHECAPQSLSRRCEAYSGKRSYSATSAINPKRIDVIRERNQQRDTQGVAEKVSAADPPCAA